MVNIINTDRYLLALAATFTIATQEIFELCTFFRFEHYIEQALSGNIGQDVINTKVIKECIPLPQLKSIISLTKQLCLTLILILGTRNINLKSFPICKCIERFINSHIIGLFGD